MQRRVTSATSRAVLTRDRIVRAAVGLIERDGEHALSMRAVAAELGVAVMSLYNHVPNKAALLSGVAEHVVAGMDLSFDAAEDWTDRARALARAFRAIAADYPRCMTIVLTQRIDSMVGLMPAERALALAAAAGFDEQTAVRVTRALMAYTLGTQLREAGMAKALGNRPDKFEDLDAERFPHVSASAAELARSEPDADFEFGLDLLLDAIDRLPRRRDQTT
ncbi:Tetracycline repressor protein class H [Actinomadura rubteroloni]|uniref:Tetracycline repressor protein class H n=1 Tax=Actinomadura rubteroloni TaxID=1926885 RepID=A0A2P4UR95_9ACTN|nr:TetR/AcrR family transcriptional regulator [Actinomadura rubteroloni]POM27556.1 Tetracycline repressor protein class H [Actinomadura rubteroloni]